MSITKEFGTESKSDYTNTVIKKNDLTNLSDAVKRSWDALDEETRKRLEGFGGGEKVEPIPQLITTPCEKVYSGKNNTWIVLGRDRPGSGGSGYGGDGSSNAGCIDICVGRAGRQAKETAPDGTPLFVDNDFVNDAARIYISQKTSLDRNFGIVPGWQGSPKPRSGVGIKADLVRIVARENIKLVTRTDDTNSQEGKIGTIGGIDLIAGNDDSNLQPLVLGKNLRECIFYMLQDISSLTQAVHDMALTQMSIETVLAGHIHTAAGAVTAPSAEMAVAVALKSLKQITFDYPAHIAQIINHIMMRFKFITPSIGSYICSERNNTN